MVDFNKAAAAIDRVINKSKEEELEEVEINLHFMGVPGTGITWKRILEYAETYHIRSEDLLGEGEEPPSPSLVMSEDQERAWKKITEWANNDSPFFVLKGVPGSGKSWLTAKLKDLGKKVYFTAPTNKAAKVLGNFVGATAKTTFSQLGLRMSADDEELVMDYNSANVYMPKNSILVVDECSMISTKLFEFLLRAQSDSLFKIFFVGDPAQLPPISEKTSPVWKVTDDKRCKASLVKVMRFDNQILNLATRIREQMQSRDYSFPIEDDNDKRGGVYLLGHYEDFLKRICLDSTEDYVNNKVIAWRNKTVNHYNSIIRSHLGFTDDYHVGEIVLIASPVEQDGRIIANIDDEFTVNSITETEIKADNVYIPVYRMSLKADTSIVVNIPIEEEPLSTILTRLAAIAKKLQGKERSQAWRNFWEVRNKFHNLRYGYSITSHRVQGTTLNNCFIDSQDILANKNKREAWRSLYVASTRPTKALYTY